MTSPMTNEADENMTAPYARVFEGASRNKTDGSLTTPWEGLHGSELATVRSTEARPTGG
jgi:hypothetical protein